MEHQNTPNTLESREYPLVVRARIMLILTTRMWGKPEPLLPGEKMQVSLAHIIKALIDDYELDHILFALVDLFMRLDIDIGNQQDPSNWKVTLMLDDDRDDYQQEHMTRYRKFGEGHYYALLRARAEDILAAKS